MNGEQFAGIYQQFAGSLNETWGKLTGDALRESAGKRARIIGKAQQCNGIEKEESARQMRDFLNRNRNWNL